jgi:hypothetical protein
MESIDVDNLVNIKYVLAPLKPNVFARARIIQHVIKCGILLTSLLLFLIILDILLVQVCFIDFGHRAWFGASSLVDMDDMVDLWYEPWQTLPCCLFQVHFDVTISQIIVLDFTNKWIR